ncbi:chorismate mutase [Bifidobacterium sp. UTCIF-39]|uniref:prephenate dehydratase n=1 Tax=Bifidobacterium sp. UTCIF-39 TaxID=1465359 RepID=UPI001128101D|nr:prephenate dehydratase domain-containing protein [Bifidobacterium sp. UTCIF-39]TPF97694.1 chorismate mutase [Bifidobacterium sp. UTCIF-39]
MTVSLHYLGPQGSFTHQAASAAAELIPDGGECIAEPNVTAIFNAVANGDGWGVVAWESNIEGYVVPNLDALIDAEDVAGFARVSVDVAFDALVRPGHGDLTVVRAHPHGLAQCSKFIVEHGLTAEPSSSNAAACRDIASDEVALGPSICAGLYGLNVLCKDVQDFDGAVTDFLVLAPREQAREQLAQAESNGVVEFESIVAFIPLSTGPGVLADLLDVIRDAGLNMTSFISRPIKGHAGTYSFIATLDAAPWQPQFKTVLSTVAAHGDWVKTLAVYPRRERPNPPVSAWMLPKGGVRLDSADVSGARFEPDDDRELLWA